jgi:predicted Zn-dependent protease with MMP-like domain
MICSALLQPLIAQIIRDPEPRFTAGKLLVAVFVLIALLFISRSINARAANLARGKHPRLSVHTPWTAFARAKEVILSTIEALPPELKTRTATAPWVLKDWPEDGREILGLYCTVPANLIIIFVGAIHHHCKTSQLDFAAEIRTTYLHELGHALGLSEEEVQIRGL